MFYKVLFILTIINFVREINRNFKEYKAVQAEADNIAAQTDAPAWLYVKIGLSALFHVMVLTLPFAFIIFKLLPLDLTWKVILSSVFVITILR